MRKRLLTVVVPVMLLFLLAPAAAFAGSEEAPVDISVSPRYQYIDRVTTSLSITAGTAAASVRVKDNDEAISKISCRMHLQKYSAGKWRNIKSWFKRVKSDELIMSNTKSVSKGKYRVKVIVKAYKGNRHETITRYSAIKNY